MKFSATLMVLATVAIESASAGTIRHAHQHIHAKKDASKVERGWTPPPGYDYHTDAAYLATVNSAQPTAAPVAAPAAKVKTPSKVKSNSGVSQILKGGNGKFSLTSSSKTITNGIAKILCGSNPTSGSATDFLWVSDSDKGTYTNEIINNSGEDVTVAFMKKDEGANLGQSQWMEQFAPAVTVNIPAGGSAPVQMHENTSGSFAVMYPDTGLQAAGLLASTLGEWTTAGADTTFDVSLLWSKSGRGMTIDTLNGCQSKTEGAACAFLCKDKSADSCWKAGDVDFNQVGENCNLGFRTIDGQKVPEGGCKVTDKKHIKTYLF